MGIPRSEWLQDCQIQFGEAPRAFGLWERLTYLRVPAPSWLDKTDLLTLYFRGQKRLLRDGFVTWGHFVQANKLLFQEGRESCPAAVTFSPNPDRPADPTTLQRAAGRLFALKGTTPAEPMAGTMAQHLTNEYSRPFGLPVPPAIHPGSLVLSTVYVYRPHLPSPRYLCRSLVPLVVSPTAPRTAMLLPARYWPADLLDWWAAD